MIPPDEYALGDDSAYTNLVVQRNLQHAIEAAHLLGRPVNPQWQKSAKALRIPFDPERGIHPEFEGYNGQQIKQADVVCEL